MSEPDASVPDTAPERIRANLLLCDAAQVVGGKLYILGGGWSYQYLQHPDNPVAVVVALDVTVPWGRANQQLKLAITITSEDGNTVEDEEDKPVQMEGSFIVGRPPTARAGADIHVPLVIPFRPFKVDPGGYVCEVFVDGDVIAKTGFQVLLLPPQFQLGGQP